MDPGWEVKRSVPWLDNHRVGVRVGILVSIALSCPLGAGCGGGDDATKEQPAAAEKPPAIALLPKDGIEKMRVGSVERAFAEYWASLQFQAWPSAIAAYSPQLRDRLGGEGRLSEVFKSQASYYRSAQPRVVRSTSDRGLTTVQYVVTGSDGDRVPRSVIFRRVDGGWEIVFDSYLDQALAGDVQTVTQQAIDPKADEPSRTAVKAGEGASRLQSRWLNDLLSPSG